MTEQEALSLDVGDKVRCDVHRFPNDTVGNVYEIRQKSSQFGDWIYVKNDDFGQPNSFKSSDFTLVARAAAPGLKPSHGLFKKGDMVQVVDAAAGKYSLTTPGSYGVVTADMLPGSSVAMVNFTCLTSGCIPSTVYYVESKYLELKSPSTAAGLAASVINSEAPHDCMQSLVQYEGLTDRFRYCRYCDKKVRD